MKELELGGSVCLPKVWKELLKNTSEVRSSPQSQAATSPVIGAGEKEGLGTWVGKRYKEQ